jgi:hypothetical protein
MYELCDEYDVVEFIEIGRIRWAGLKKVTLQGKCFVLNQEEVEKDGRGSWRRTF